LNHVWWHTFSHRLITALAQHTGYGSASLRERLYVAIGDASDLRNGALLVYTAQAGGDGTLGGLVDVGARVAPVIAIALEIAHSCSNDPLCVEMKKTSGRVNGAACYSCALISETSCEM